MNLVLLFADDFVGTGGRVRLQGRRLRHVREVHRARVDDELRVGLLNGPCGTGRIRELSATTLEMDTVLDCEPPPRLPLTLVLALPRPKTLKKALQAATAMGVKRIVVVQAWRVEKSFWQSSILEEAALREQLVLGLEQAGDTMLPEVWLRRRFKPFVQDELPELADGSAALVAHPAAVRTCPRDIRSRVTLAVGPEGGFIQYELDLLIAGGFEPVSLGPRPLRVEHAIPALLGRLF